MTPLSASPGTNRPNMFGLYCVDRFGNKELLYRDLNLSSVWPAPLRPRPRPPQIASALEATDKAEGTFFLQNVYESWVPLPKEKIAGLRIIQVLPKTTPNASDPMPGLAGTSPGKQVLGTVPVESDGSAYFRAPARIPLQFQALDSPGPGRADDVTASSISSPVRPPLAPAATSEMPLPCRSIPVLPPRPCGDRPPISRLVRMDPSR